jgi:photosystem II stability/assembly factor-like uncharacterized protein
MKKIRVINLIVRIVLFTLILSVGTMAALVTGESKGLALSDLSGGSVRAMAMGTQGHVVYAGLIGGPQPTGIYRSDDDGSTWQVVSSGPGVAVNALAVHPNNNAVLYAGTAGGPATTTDSLWRSDNGGQTWQRFVLGLPANPYGMVPSVTALAVDPDQPNLLYVGTDGQGVYQFDEGRNSYQLVGGVSLYNVHVTGLVVGSDNRLYALTSDGLFTTRGYAWEKINTLPELAVSLAVAPSDPQTLYAGGTSTGAYRATDGGKTWEKISNGLEMVPGTALRVVALAVDEHNSNHVVAATAYGIGSDLARGAIYESTNAGRNWTKLADASGLVVGLTFNQGMVYAATAAGLARYGKPTQAASAVALPDLRPLTNPTGVQVLILVLTIALGGLALLGRPEWVGRRSHVTAS